MKSIIKYMLIACLMFTLLAPALPVLAEEADELLPNGGFEEALEDGKIPDWGTWTPRGDATVELVNDEAYEGQNSVKISATEESSLGALTYRYRFGGAIGEEKLFMLSYWAKSENTEKSENDSCVCTRVQFQDENGSHIKGIENVGDASGTHDWTFYSQLLDIPAETATLVIEPILSKGTGELWFDNISMVEVDPIQSGSFSNESASVLASGVVHIGWEHDFIMDPSTSFDVHRSDVSGFTPDEFTLIGTTTESSYFDQAVSANNPYYYVIVLSTDDASMASSEVSVAIPATLPDVQPVDSLMALYTVANTTALYWEISNDQRAHSVNIYGSDEEITEANKSDAAIIETSVLATLDEYVLDITEEVYDYFAVSVVDGDGRESEVVGSMLESFLPRLDENVTEPSSDHPYLLANQEMIDEVRANIPHYIWMQNTVNKLALEAEAAVDAYGSTTDPLPPNDPGHITMAENARLLSIAYVLTDDVRYADAAKNILLLYADYYQNETYITNEGENDSTILFTLTIAYDFVHKHLNAEERETIENDYFRVGADLVMNLHSGAMEAHGKIWNVAFVGFLLKEQSYLNFAFDEANYGMMYSFINGINDDGFWWEIGPSYHDERTEKTMMLAEVARNSNFDLYGYQMEGRRDIEYDGLGASGYIEGRIVDVEGKSIKELIDHELNFLYPNLTRPQIADSSTPKLRPSFMLEAAYARYGDEKYGQVLSNFYGPDRLSGGIGISQYESLFLAHPTLPETNTYFIGNEHFNKRGYHKLGSTLFLDTGYSMMRANSDIFTNTGMIWNNFGTKAGHMQADKLSIVMNAFNQNVLTDPGRYTYGSTGHTEYALHTIAHNTVVVDETSQSPQRDTVVQFPRDEVGETSRSYLKELTVGPVLKLTQAENNDAANPGVNMDRTIAQIDDYVIDIFQVDSDTEHQYDYPLTINGIFEDTSLNLTALDPEQALSDALGYKYIKHLSEGSTSDMWSSNWDFRDGKKFRTTMLGSEGTEVVKGSGLASDGDQDREMILARRGDLKETIFISVLEPYFENTGHRTVTPLTVDASSSTDGKDQALQVVSADNSTTDTFLVGMGAHDDIKEAGSIKSDGDSAFHRAENGEDSVVAVVNGTYVSGENLSIDMSFKATAQLTKMNEHAYRLDFDGKEETTVTIPADPSYSVHEMALSDDIELTDTSFTSSDGMIHFTAQPNHIYVIGSPQGISALKPPTKVEMGASFVSDSMTVGGIKIVEEPLEGMIVEAEDFTLQEGGEVTIVFRDGSHTTNHPEGDAFYGWDDTGHRFEWEFDIEEAGEYRLMLNFATRVFDSVRKMSIDDGEEYQFHFPTTIGWNNRENALLQVNQEDLLFQLEEGTHTLQMENITGALNLDYFVFEKVSETPIEVTIESIQDLVTSYDEDGAFTNEQSVRALNIHLTSVQIFEQQENAEKITRHMEGFLMLLNHQKDHMLISGEAYQDLKAEAEALIQQWQ